MSIIPLYKVDSSWKWAIHDYKGNLLYTGTYDECRYKLNEIIYGGIEKK